MPAKSYEVPDPKQNPDAYLSYSVQDAPSVEYSDYLHSRGMHDSWWRRHFGPSESRYEAWKQTQLQDYKNYLDAYDINYNSEFARRARLEAAGFSGQYLANGIGGSSSSSTPGLSSGIQQSFGSPHGEGRGLNKVMQTLQLMSSAGIAMKNFGEGKAAMKYADQIGANKAIAGRNANENAVEILLKNHVLNANPNDYGYWLNRETGMYEFTGKGTDSSNPNHILHSLWMDEKIKKLNGMDLGNDLRQLEAWQKNLDYNIDVKFKEATAKAQKELLEGKKAYQDIENEYVGALKAMGIGMPIIQLLAKHLL